jgi:aspartyl/asparaginyl beta-hydroxylase (cupin superfamily)
MSTPAIDALSLARSGLEALRRGDAQQAREALEPIVASGQADAATCFGLAFACRKLDDKQACLAAVDKALALDPRNLRALLLKADCLMELGDVRAASTFYQFAIQAAPPAHELPSGLREDLARAASVCERNATQFETYLQERLGALGLLDGRGAGRFRHSLDLLVGKRQVYFQQPNTYFFPELPQIQFYDRDAFPCLDAVEAATARIRDELLEVLKETSAFTPYVQGSAKRPHKDQSGMQDNPDWSAFFLWKHGEPLAANIARCPQTVTALAEVPLCTMKNRSPSVLFSLLRPGARIPAHTGLVNTRLICHLPLIVPPGCGFRVGNDSRVPVEGKAWLFDDTIEHEAWNNSSQTRVILLFEIWRPELSQEERAQVTAMFDAIDAYSGQKPDWEI